MNTNLKLLIFSMHSFFIFDNNYDLSEKDIVRVKIKGIKWNQLEVKAIIVV